MTNLEEVKLNLEVAEATLQPLFIHGSMGIGKSEVVKSFCRESAERQKLNFKEYSVLSEGERIEYNNNKKVRENTFLFVDLRAAQLQPADIKGMPDMLNTKGDFLLWKAPLEFSVIVQEGAKGCLFLDELNLADGSTQKALYQIILDRVVGDRKISKGIFLVAAGNRREDKAAVIPMGLPLVDRFDHITMVVPTVREWVKYSAKVGSYVPGIAAYLNWSPEGLQTPSEQLLKLGDSSSFATPRSWSSLCKKFLKFPDASLEKKKLFAKASIGEAQASQLVSFLKLEDSLDIEEILEEPSKLKGLSSARDILFAHVGKLISVAKEQPKRIQKVVDCLPHIDIEFGVLILRGIKDLNFQLLKQVCSKPDNIWVLEKYPKFWN